MNCAPTFFKELHSYDGVSHSLVINEITGDVGVLKKLDHYNEEVYDELSGLKSKHLPRILCHGSFENFCSGNYIVIEEHISGMTLEEYLTTNKPSLNERMRFFREIADALIELHSLPKPVIHRDVKASNILITNQGNAVLTDFDAAKIKNPEEARDTTLIGTEGYAAPEQYGFAPSDERTDIYAFGKLIEKMFPDSAKMQKMAKRATAMDPKYRFNSVRDMRYSNIDLKHSIFPPPGFRSGNVAKAVLACVGYAYFSSWLVRIGIDTQNPLYVKLMLQFCAFLLFVLELDLIFDWLHIMGKLPFVLHPKKSVRILAKILWAIVAIPMALAVTVVVFYIIFLPLL